MNQNNDQYLSDGTSSISKKKSSEEDISKKVFYLGKDYKGVSKLGSGSYGTVYKVRKASTGELFAVKNFKMDKENDGIPSTALREITILKSLNHPNIVAVKDIAFGSKHIELCLEYCKYDLRSLIDDKIKDKSFYNEKFIKKIMFQIFQGVDFLHSHKMFHRDLKPQNILVTDTYVAKLADFGLSRVYSIPLRPYTKEILTLWYRSPEMLLGVDLYSIGVDMWSLGCILVEMYLSKPFVRGDSEIDQLFKIMQIFGSFNEVILPGYKSYPCFNEEFPYWEPVGLENYLNNKTVINLSRDAIDLIKKILVIDPVKRLNCKDALNHPYFDEVRAQCQKDGFYS